MKNQTLLLTHQQIAQKINRLAYQIYEDNIEEKEIIVAGVMKSGYLMAEKIAAVLSKISPLKIKLIPLAINKHSEHSDPEASGATVSLAANDLNDKVVIVVDDVLNSGKTMMYSIRPFLNADIRKLRIVVLVDRNHKRYPIAADFVGLSLSTTLQEHVSVELGEKEEAVYLS